MKVSVIGSGISGLAAAFFASKAGHKTDLVINKKITGKFSGLASTIYHENWEFDIGPQIVKISPAAVSLFDIASEIGMGGQIQVSNLDSDDKLVYFNKKLRNYSERPEYERKLEKIKSGQVEDESIYEFYLKNLKISDNELAYQLDVLVDASVLSYYAVGPKAISARSSNLTSAEFHKKYNVPLIKPFYRYESADPAAKNKLNDLIKKGGKSFRFKGGWSAFALRLLDYLKGCNVSIVEDYVSAIHDSKEITLSSGKKMRFDHVISTTNSLELSSIYPKLQFDVPHKTWTVVNLGYESPLNLPYFGYAVPQLENSSLLAAVFNYSVFPENKPTVTLLGLGDHSDIVKDFLTQTKAKQPDFGLARSLESASPQYRVGHFQQQIKSLLKPDWLSIAGHSFFHSGIPSCVIRAKEIVDNLS